MQTPRAVQPPPQHGALELCRLAQAALLAALALAATPVAAAPRQLLGSEEQRIDSLEALPQWRRVLQRSAAEAGVVRACLADGDGCPNPPTRAWAALLHRLAGMPARAQVDAVHRFVNAWKYRSDADNYGRSDYWATPLEFFRRSGDCEDYVIAKYRSLRLLGLRADQLRMVVVQDVVRDLPHAVLAIYLGDEVLISDNLSERVLTQQEVGSYAPYYSVNEEARWAHALPDGLVAARTIAGVQPARP
jgi:predicted transglutaminase-like cysteine proteinase